MEHQQEIFSISCKRAHARGSLRASQFPHDDGVNMSEVKRGKNLSLTKWLMIPLFLLFVTFLPTLSYSPKVKMVGTNLRLLEQRFQKLETREKKMPRSMTTSTRYHLASKRDPRLDEELVYESRDYVSHSPRNTAPLRAEESRVKSTVQRDVAGGTAAMKKHVEQFLAKVETSRQMLHNVDADLAPHEEATDATFMTSTNLRNASRLRDDIHFAELFATDTAMETEQEEQVISRVIDSDHFLMSGGHESASSYQPQVNRPVTAPKRVTTASTVNRTTFSGSSYANANPVKLRVGERPSTAQGVSSKPNSVSKMVAAFFRSLPPVVPPRPASSLPKRVFPSPHPARDELQPPPSATATIAAAAMTKEFYNLQIRIVHSDPNLSKWEFTVVVSDVTSVSTATPQQKFHRLRVTSNNYIIFHPPANVILSPCDDIPWVAGPGALYNHTLRLEVFATLPQHTKVVDTLVFYGKTPPSGPS